MEKQKNFTTGGVLGPLVKFAIPVFAAMFLQSLYGAVDLLIVGQFAETVDVSGVATGTMLIHAVTMIITGLAMGITVYVGQKIGEKDLEEAGRAVGAGIVLFSIAGIILLVAGFGLGSMGAALATVAAQAISVVISVMIISKKELPFTFKKEFIRFDQSLILKEVRLGAPIALQDFLVGISFLVIMAVVNSINVTASAGVGVAEKVCAFIMLVPSAFSQAMAAFVAQNIGAGINRSFLCKNSGCASHEPDCRGKSVLYWAWNTGIYSGADCVMCWIHAVSGKEGIEWQKDERYLENFIL